MDEREPEKSDIFGNGREQEEYSSEDDSEGNSTLTYNDTLNIVKEASNGKHQ